jgi:hypothetical protein
VTDPDAALANIHTGNTSNRLIRIGKKSKAAVILVSGCQDNQTSMDGDLFTLGAAAKFKKQQRFSV